MLIALLVKPRPIVINLLQNFSRDFEESMNMTRLVRIELIRTRRPPTDKCLPFQLLSFSQSIVLLPSNHYYSVSYDAWEFQGI
jgi:hypothetical protein